MDKSEIIKNIALLLLENNKPAAKDLLQNQYTHQTTEIHSRSYSLKDKMLQFITDGFIDRYTGKKLINPGLLKIISCYFPNEFPYDPHWKMTKTHPAYWDFVPTIDHIIPIAKGGLDRPENRVTTSMKNNSIKSNYSLDEINWNLFPKGNCQEWDGLTQVFIELVENDVELCNDPYINRWYKVSKNLYSALISEKIFIFTRKWIKKFSDKNINYLELVDSYFADDCNSLGFEMDCGKAFQEKYGKAVYNSKELDLILDQISDISLLGSAIYSRWRYFNHWAYSAEEILEEENRKWFLLALNRLSELANHNT